MTLIEQAIVATKDGTLSTIEVVAVVVLFSNAVNSFEFPAIRTCVMKCVGLSLWTSLSEGRLQLELQKHPNIRKKWRKLTLRRRDLETDEQSCLFVPWIIGHVSELLTGSTAVLDGDQVVLVQVSVKLCIDLLSQLPTRRFFHAFLEDVGFLVTLSMSTNLVTDDGASIKPLVELLKHMMEFPVDSITGDPLRDEDLTGRYYEKVEQAQRLLFKYWDGDLKAMSLMSAGNVFNAAEVDSVITSLSPVDLENLVCKQLKLCIKKENRSPDYLKRILKQYINQPSSSKELIISMPLYPTELLLDRVSQFSTNRLRLMHHQTLPSPKLNLQFLSMVDYLERNFNLYRLEAAYDIREHLGDVIERMNPTLQDDGTVGFDGWSRMGQTVDGMRVTEVKAPRAGQRFPASVTAEVLFTTRHMTDNVREEWDQLREHDIVFFVGIRGTEGNAGQKSSFRVFDFLDPSMIMYIRGGEVLDLRDEGMKVFLVLQIILKCMSSRIDFIKCPPTMK